MGEMPEDEMGNNKANIQLPDGSMRMCTEIDVMEAVEKWNDIQLADGTFLRLKSAITRVLRVDDVYDPEGNPMYVVQSAQLLVVKAPDALKRK